jgi:transcriptional regulator with XRE-family HTH domain
LIRLAIERKRRGWTQGELARRSGLHSTTISLIEGRRFVPGAAQIEKLRAAFGVRPDDAERLLEQIEVEPLTEVVPAAR